MIDGNNMHNTIFIESKRDLSLDVIKIFSCVLVVMMHTLRHIDITVSLHPFLYYFTRCSMPLFFMASGAIVFTREEIRPEYCFKKIRDIIIVMLGYYFIDGVVRLLMVPHFSYNKNVIHDIIQTVDSDFGVFWFLRTLIILYFILPELHSFYKKNSKKLLCVLACICILIDFLNIINVKFLGGNIYLQRLLPLQECRLWTWLLYYVLGGVIYQHRRLYVKTNKYAIISLITTVIAIFYMYHMLYVSTNIINGEYAYDSVLVILWSASLMITCLSLSFQKIKSTIGSLVKLIMPIYALHGFFLIYLENNAVFQSYWMQIVAWGGIVSLAASIGWLMHKIPVIKRLTHI